MAFWVRFGVLRFGDARPVGVNRRTTGADSNRNCVLARRADQYPDEWLIADTLDVTDLTSGGYRCNSSHRHFIPLTSNGNRELFFGKFHLKSKGANHDSNIKVDGNNRAA